MSTLEQFEQRLSAVERTVVDGDHDVPALSDIDDLRQTVDALADQVETIDSRLLAVESGVEALEGYVGNIQSVNQSVERQADIAIVSAGRVENRLNKIEQEVSAATITTATITTLAQRIVELETELEAISDQVAAEEDGTDGFDEFVFDTPGGEGSDDTDTGTEVDVSADGESGTPTGTHEESPVDAT